MKTSYHLNLSRGRKTSGLAMALLGVFLFSAQLTLAAPTNINYGIGQSAIETVGTKSTKLKSQGSSGVDQSTGAFTYTYTVDLPNARGDIQPDLTLTYNSQNIQNGLFGAGWSSSIPYVERGNKEGIDKMYTNPTFVSSLSGELVSTDQINYVAKVDDGSFHEYAYKNGYFTMKDRNGILYTFGQTTTSQVSDGASKIGRWYLTEIKDTYGNYVTYNYVKYDGQVYPSSILYTNNVNQAGAHAVYFDLEDRADNSTSYTYGFLVETKKRLKTIRIEEAASPIASVQLSYAVGSNGVKSLLSSFSESRKGTDGQWTTTPNTGFQYENGAYGYSATSTEFIGKNSTYIDINGDGRGEQYTSADYINEKTEAVDRNGDYQTDFVENTKLQSYYTYQTFFEAKNNAGTLTKVTNPSLNVPQMGFQPNSVPAYLPEHK